MLSDNYRNEAEINAIGKDHNSCFTWNKDSFTQARKRNSTAFCLNTNKFKNVPKREDETGQRLEADQSTIGKDAGGSEAREHMYAHS